MRWTVHGERTLYNSSWVRLTLVDVEVPGGERFEHHVVRIPREAAAAVVRDPERGEQAAGRETLEETGWRPGPSAPSARSSR